MEELTYRYITVTIERSMAQEVPKVGFRMRKSFKIAPGVRMTVTPRGIGTSVGGRAGRVRVHSSGRAAAVASIPGTGISHTTTLSSGSRGTRSTNSGQLTPAAPPAPAAPTPDKPGMLSPKWEKQLFRAIAANDWAALQTIASSDARARPTCQLLDAMLVSFTAGDNRRARQLLEPLWAEGYDPSTDQFMVKYVRSLRMTLDVAEGITASLTMDRDALGLSLAELRQEDGDLQGAVDLVEQVEPSTVAAVSLAELYAQQQRWTEIVALTDHVANDDEFATFLLIQRGIALRELGHYTASREAFKTALAPRSRPAGLRHLALVERSETYRSEGKKAMARKDLERVLAEDSTYPDLHQRLARLA